jgi:glycosyltransferase involved in cell wall biosynthesis
VDLHANESIHTAVGPPADTVSGAVLHVRVISGSTGGPDKTIFASAAPLAGTRYRVVAAYLHVPGDPGFLAAERQARAQGCPLVGVPERGPLDPRPIARLLDLCRRLDVRLWHGHDYKSNLFGLWLRRFVPMRLVTTAHGWVKHTARTRIYYAVDRLCLPRYDHVIAVSPDLYERVRGLGIPRERCSLLNNAVDADTFRRRSDASEATLRRRFAVPRGRSVVGAAGRLGTEKGFDVLIRAVHALAARGFDFELWIAGTGEEEDRLRALCGDLGIADRVRFLGFVADMVELFEALDVFVLSSRREGLPNVLLEAMAMGVPVVATGIAGAPEAVRDGENGLLSAPDDVPGLADRVARLLADPDLRSVLAVAGRRTVEERFRFAARVQAESEIYDRLLQPSSSQRTRQVTTRSPP